MRQCHTTSISQPKNRTKNFHKHKFRYKSNINKPNRRYFLLQNFHENHFPNRNTIKIIIIIFFRACRSLTLTGWSTAASRRHKPWGRRQKELLKSLFCLRPHGFRLAGFRLRPHAANLLVHRRLNEKMRGRRLKTNTSSSKMTHFFVFKKYLRVIFYFWNIFIIQRILWYPPLSPFASKALPNAGGFFIIIIVPSGKSNLPL